MHISKMKLHNFRSFEGVHELVFKPGINFFVGNNNSGKTTIFKAIEFIQSGKNKTDWITIGKEDDDVSVEITFSGNDLETLVEQDSLAKYKDFVFDNNNTKNLKILRDSSSHSWTQRAKTSTKGTTKTTSISNVLVWHSQEHEWKNPTGIDKTISALFDAQFVYSDLKNEDYQDFGKAKIVGKLINSVTQDFQDSQAFKKLKAAHENAFGDQGLTATLKETQSKIQNIISQQYGETQIEFKFGLPDLDNFFKTGQILLSDNGVSTDVSEKGTGMQRALALALIQLYAEVAKPNNSQDKPILFFIDEPETFLHPIAQDKLIDSLKKISVDSQIFITTHSPYLLKKFDKTSNQINVFSRAEVRISDNKDLALFPFSPTWGEINYIAFDVPSIEFHNELFGYLQNVSQVSDEKAFDNWLTATNVVEKNINYIREKNGNQITQQKTLPMYIRNIIHHPENTNNQYTTEQLAKSIDKMIEIITQTNRQSVQETQ
ncbi:UNVERIFIED_ORG: putative ATP-dependent endonuclease of OLD family [Leuconostoc holzapfelii]